MVRLAKRNLKGGTYYYLEHTVRDRGRRSTKSRYVGRRIPGNIDAIRRSFLFELDKAKWFDRFEEVKRNYATALKETPKSGVEKGYQEFSIRFTYDTQRIEGSTLTLRETARLLEEGVSPSGRPIRDVKEAEAHHKVFLGMLGTPTDLSQRLVQDWHWMMFKETKPDIAGQIRTHGVKIAGSRFIPPAPVELQPLLREFFNWYRKQQGKTHPVELAGLVHLKFVTIHPFTDGNGRISRLMMNLVLHKYGFPMLNIEYRGRASYYGALERSQVRGDERPFLNWFFRRYLGESKMFIR